jgi:hypothetical protein
MITQQVASFITFSVLDITFEGYGCGATTYVRENCVNIVSMTDTLDWL